MISQQMNLGKYFRQDVLVKILEAIMCSSSNWNRKTNNGNSFADLINLIILSYRPDYVA
jgi:hypothetical protein